MEGLCEGDPADGPLGEARLQELIVSNPGVSLEIISQAPLSPQQANIHPRGTPSEATQATPSLAYGPKGL